MRRLFAVAVALVCWLSGCGARVGGSAGVVPQAISGTMVQRDANSSELPEPPEVDAVNGVATVSLVAEINPTNGFPTFDYNGIRDGGPTVRVKPGDTIVFDVTNDLPRGRGPAELAYGRNSTCIFTDSKFPPMPPADDVLRTLAMPGGSLHYVLPIPRNQEPGLYWYHPTCTARRTIRWAKPEMSGAIIIQGLEHHLPGLGKMTERMIVVRDTGLGSAVPRPDDTMDDQKHESAKHERQSLRSR